MQRLAVIGLMMTAGLMAADPTVSPSVPREGGEQAEGLQQDAMGTRTLSLPSRTQLAEDLLGRARRSGDTAFLDQAEAELQLGLRYSPEYFPLQMLEAQVALLRGDMPRALELATKLNHRMPDDLETYSLLVQANLALGELNAAVDAAQWMLTIRTDNPLSLWRAAQVRDAAGDAEGALQLLQEAYPKFTPSQSWRRTLALAEAAGLEYQLGMTSDATALAEDLRQEYPDSAEIHSLLERVP